MIRTTTTGAYRAIADRADFRTSGALSGRILTPGTYSGLTLTPWEMGRLPRDHHDSASRATYVVMSYATPIAWLTDDAWVIPDARYSATTSRHQSAARHGASLSGLAVADVAA